MGICKFDNKILRILFTSVGRRVELVQAFRNAADRLNINLVIYGADMSDTAPALFFCDRKEKICRINNQNYIPQLIEICKKENINALIPTIDTDLLTLSHNRDKFVEIGTRVLISDEEKVKICRDKRLTTSYFIKCGLKTPVLVDDIRKYKFGFPCFIKPQDGSSSINAYKIDNQAELEFYCKKVKNYIIQPFVLGKEYTVDIFCDLNGQPIYITPRERIAVRSGEVLITKIVQDAKIIDECKQIVASFMPCGPITIQLIQDRDTGENFYIEINPRFGGGVPLSIKAGADAAEALLRILLGEQVYYLCKVAKDGMLFSRFDQSVSINDSESNGFVQAVIFDLDDTLYSEKEYVLSGFSAIADIIPQVENATTKLWKAFKDGKHAIDDVLKSEGIYSNKLKDRCLNAYRLHNPDIKFYNGVRELLINIKKGGKKIGIITDGRPEGQRAKIKALGLEELVDEIIITDELGGIKFRKPNDIAFQIMKNRLEVDYSNMVYIGDNPEKDFIAPDKLGMKSIYFNNFNGLYRTKTKLNNERYTVHNIQDIIVISNKWLCKSIIHKERNR